MMRLLEVPIFVVFICLVGNSISDTKPTASSTTTNGNYTETNTTERMDSTTERMDTGFALNTATDVTDSTATYTRESEVKTGVATATTTENGVSVGGGGSTEETTTIKGNKMTGEDGRNGDTTTTMTNGVTGGGGGTGGQDATATMGNAVTGNGGATENGVTGGGGGGGQGGNGNGDGNDPSIVYKVSEVKITNPDDAIFGLETGQNVNVKVSIVLPSSSSPVTGTSNWACYFILTNATATSPDDNNVHYFVNEEATIEPAADVGRNLAAGETYTFSAVATLPMVNITKCEYTHLCVNFKPHANATWTVNGENSEYIKCKEVMCGVAAMKLHLALVAVVLCIHALHKGVFCS